MRRINKTTSVTSLGRGRPARPNLTLQRPATNSAMIFGIWDEPRKQLQRIDFLCTRAAVAVEVMRFDDETACGR